MITAAECVGAFIETLGYEISGVADGYIEVYVETNRPGPIDLRLIHISSVVVNETKVVCSSPGYGCPEYKFDLHNPKSLPELKKRLKQLEREMCTQST
jgi:hypothetical protein